MNTDAAGSPSYRPCLFAHAAVVATFVAMVVAAAWACGGHFMYSLDDPYIHLAMSEEIAHGGYGVNSGEWAAASSSILYPLLLAAGAGTWCHEYLPLAINFAALLLTVHVLWRYLAHLGLQATAGGRVVSALVVGWSIVALNVVSLTLSGLEHNLHVLTTLGVLYGVVLFLDGGRVRWWFVLALLAGPLVRYEAVAVSVGALLVLGLGNRRAIALLVGALVVGSLLVFSFMLVRAGLAPLPSSVLVKLSSSGVRGDPLQLVIGMLRKVDEAINLTVRPGILLGAFGVVAFAASLVSLRERQRARLVFLLFYLLTIVAHLAVGAYGWFNRYEIYVLVFAVMGALHLWRDQLRAMIERGAGMPALLLFVAIGFVGGPYVTTLHVVPRACRNVYEQQFQMHRFAREFHRGPIAVNDLGWVAYRNPQYVLDLWGLGSEPIRLATRDGLSPDEVDALAKQHDVGLAMLYEDLLAESIPPSWQRVGRLHLAGPRITVRRDTVEFFATRPAAAAQVRRELAAFRPTLPPGVRLEIFE